MPYSQVTPATANVPIPPNGGPALGPADGQGPAIVAPPTGAAAAPRTANEQSQGAADPRASSAPAGAQAGAGRTSGWPPMEGDGNVKPATSGNGMQLVFMLATIALAAYSGYVSWLFYDARQRYLGLLARAFAPAGQATST